MTENQEMQQSPGAQMLRQAFTRSRCRGVAIGSPEGAYSTVAPGWETVLNSESADWSSTAAQVGGFTGSATPNAGRGTVTYTIYNEAGTKSFFAGGLGSGAQNRRSPTGPMGTITQTFQWTEPVSTCGCK
jgi:hypothetical protein